MEEVFLQVKLSIKPVVGPRTGSRSRRRRAACRDGKLLAAQGLIEEQELPRDGKRMESAAERLKVSWRVLAE